MLPATHTHRESGHMGSSTVLEGGGGAIAVLYMEDVSESTHGEGARVMVRGLVVSECTKISTGSQWGHLTPSDGLGGLG